jgi:hypothetical protein
METGMWLNPTIEGETGPEGEEQVSKGKCTNGGGYTNDCAHGGGHENGCTNGSDH